MDRNQLLNDPEEALRIALDGRQSSMWTALPGYITAVDFDTMTVSVQPTIQGTIEDENGVTQQVNLPLLINVPIVFPSGGGFLITLPLAVNDEVLVVFASRCIDSWWQSGGVGVAMEARMHDLSDGFAIPGPRSLPKVVGSINTNDLQIRNEEGDVYVSVTSDGKIKLVSSAGIEITGNLLVSGTVTASDFISGLLHFTTHKHIGVTVGGGTSGTPTP